MLVTSLKRINSHRHRDHTMNFVAFFYLIQIIASSLCKVTNEVRLLP